MKIKISGPNVYVDTKIIRDYSDRRDPKSIHLLETIRNKKWKCSSSVFTMMELCDVEKDHLFFQNTYVKQKWTVDRFLRERYKRSLSDPDFKSVKDYIDNVTESLSFIEFFALREGGWNLALNLSMNTNLRAADCIQLATALSQKCESFVTNDEHFRKILKKLAGESDLGTFISVYDSKGFVQDLERSC
jgi:predicted nucleic acid-binding protein